MKILPQDRLELGFIVFGANFLTLVTSGNIFKCASNVATPAFDFFSRKRTDPASLPFSEAIRGVSHKDLSCKAN